MRKAAVVLMLFASPAAAQNAPLSDGPITCSSPVTPDDSAKSLKQRYGQEAVIQQLTGAEGETYKGLILMPRAMDRRIEVSFKDDSLSEVTGLTLRDTAKASRWNVAGVTIGSSLVEVQNINGKPFLLNGFEWDYSGFVTNWRGGMLGQPLPGGCRIAVRFGMEGKAPKFWLGDVRLSSDNVGLVKRGPVVTEIGVNFSAK